MTESSAALAALDELERRLADVVEDRGPRGVVSAGEVLQYHVDAIRRVVRMFCVIEERATCDARVRPFRPVNDVEVACGLDPDHQGTMHRGVVRDYAGRGSKTGIEWADEDRRSYRGEWPGACRAEQLDIDCVLPLGHRGRCAP